MTKRHRRRSSRNIWGAPPEPSAPFDYENHDEEDESPEVPPEEPPEFEDQIVVAEPAEDEAPEPEPPRGPKHLQKRAVVLPRLGSKRGKHLAREETAPSEPVVELDEVSESEEPISQSEEPISQSEEPISQSEEPIEIEATAIADPEPVIAEEVEPVAFDEELLPEDEIFPARSRRRGKHRKRTIVPRKSPQGKHAVVPEAPPEPEPSVEAAAEIVEEEVPEEVESEYRPKHGGRRRVVLPGRKRPGKHSLGAPPPRAPDQPELPDRGGGEPDVVPEVDDHVAEPQVEEAEAEAEAEIHGLEEVEPPDEPEFLEEIEPYEPSTKKRRRRRRGRHREPGSPVLPRQKGSRGRHSVAPPVEDEDAAEEIPVVDAVNDEIEADVVAEEVVEEPVLELDDEEVVVVDDFDDFDDFEEEFADDEVVVIETEETEETEEAEILPSRRRRRKRSRVLRYAVGLITAVATAAATVAVVTAIDTARGPDAEDSGPRTGGAAAPKELATTTLIYAVREAKEEQGPVWLTLLSYDPSTEKASAIYIPAHLASEIPGRGLMSLSEGWVSGGPSLLLASAENLLGMKIDRYVEFSDNDAEIFFDATGPITVDVPSEVSVPQGASQARLIFDEGPQELSADFLVRLLYTRGLDVDDTELGSRILSFWDALLTHYEGDRTALGSAIRGTGPALESDADTNEIVTFFESMASVPEEQVVLASLPVRPIAAGDSELYSADLDEVQDLLEDTVGEIAATGDDVRVQILNGNGVPGIGAEVADRLIGEGFRVILSGNARSFDYDTTLIVTYDGSPEGEALAERARDLLGVGEVQISAQQQGSVDLTIVVGKDFLGAR